MKICILILTLTVSTVFADDKIIVDPDGKSSQITWDLETGDLDALDVERYPSGGASVYNYDENKFYDVEGYGDGSFDTYRMENEGECYNCD